MFEKPTASTRPKREISVTMSLAGDEVFDGKVFLRDEERLIDLLNDPRGFIPVRRVDGATVIVSKANIVSIVEGSESKTDAASASADKTAGQRRPAIDPYKVLRVSPDASLEEVRRAYKARMKAVHPDTLSGLELDDDIARAAVSASQKVTYAYQRIIRERREN